MTEVGGTVAPPPQTKEDPEGFALRARPQPVVRFRRGLIVGMCALGGVTVLGVAGLALRAPRLGVQAGRQISLPRRADSGPEALEDAPRSYGDVPQLGPPLPGDLGRPILARQRQLDVADQSDHEIRSPRRAAEQADEAARQRRAAEIQAVRSSPLLVQIGSGPASSEARAPAASTPAAGENSAISAPPPATGQQHKIDFAQSTPGHTIPGRLNPPPSPWILAAGTIIPASLITGLNSDLPGFVIAQVSEDIRDSPTGQAVLVPRGARLLGRYDSAVAFGQRRALLVWDRISFPDGSSIELDNMPATDPSGYAGLEDRVDFHSWQLIKGIGLATLLGVGTELSLGSDESDLVEALRESTQQNAARAGDQITSRNLDVQPTLTVRPGWPVRAIVHKDLVLKPWRG